MNKISSNTPENIDPYLFELLSLLSHISNKINMTSGADQNTSSLQLIADGVIQILPGSSAAIYAYDAITESFDIESRIVALTGNRESSTVDLSKDDASRPDGIGMRTIQRRQITFSYNEPDLNVPNEPGIKAVVCYPLVASEQVIGILYIYLLEARRFTRFEQLTLDNFVNLAAMSIYRSQHLTGINRDLARKNEEIKQLRRAGLVISSRLRLDETLDSILDLALEITSAQYGIFRLLDKEGESLVTSAVSGVNFERPLVEKLPMNGKSIMAHVARTREPLLIHDLKLEPWSNIYYPLDSKLEMRSELTVPLINPGGRLEGVLNLESPRPDAFTEDDKYLLLSLATYAITAIQEVRLLDALQEAAQLLVAQPTQLVLGRLCDMANDLLNATTSVIWLANENKELDITALSGSPDHALRFVDAKSNPNVILTPLDIGDDTEEVGMFGVFTTGSGEGRDGRTDWDRKVMACLANFAALALKNEAHQKTLRATQEQHWTAETFAAVGDISANLLHNMNNKVGTIPARIQSIQDKYQELLDSDPYLSKNLAEIERSAAEALRITQENLTYLRPIRLGEVFIQSCVTDAIQGIDVPADIRIEINGLGELPTILAGRQSLTFVFVNLLENAITSMQNHGSIRIYGYAVEKWVEVAVTDNGPGIPPELHKVIFELNYSGRAESQPGKMGFGLWWVKTLMTRVGGSVSVESDGQNGTTFRLRLPVNEGKNHAS